MRLEEPAMDAPDHVDRSARQLLRRYFEMWNGGDPATALDILDDHWTDRAHPDVTNPPAAMDLVELVHRARPELRFTIEATLESGDLIAAVGSASNPAMMESPAQLVWIFRVVNGKLQELRSYREVLNPPPVVA
jgi:hypothetical protein